MYGMMDVFAEFEREMIVDGVETGMARAKAEGKHCGRAAVGADKIAVKKL
jgi:DNA invertase Pin-like site-specific DNA recombinase